MRKCTIPNCFKKHKGHGLCDAHYQKLKKRGDPLFGRTNIMHGDRYTPEYKTWLHIKQRCMNIKDRDYKNYGGRGIKVCERWLGDYRLFLKDMGKRPSPKHTIDRKDNDGDYEPTNCRWVTRGIQAINKRGPSTNTSGFRGVTIHNKKWRALLSLDGVRFSIGVYPTPQEAAYVRDQVALQIHGAEAKLNFDIL